MPVRIEGLQQVAVLDLPVAAGTAFWLGVRLNGEHLYTWEKHRKRLQTLIEHDDKGDKSKNDTQNIFETRCVKNNEDEARTGSRIFISLKSYIVHLKYSIINKFRAGSGSVDTE